MRKQLRLVAIALAVTLLAMPLTILATISLLPLWSWLESTMEIEAVGHSGPAAWCYLATYLGMVLLATAIWRWRKRINRV